MPSLRLQALEVLQVEKDSSIHSLNCIVSVLTGLSVALYRGLTTVFVFYQQQTGKTHHVRWHVWIFGKLHNTSHIGVKGPHKRLFQWPSFSSLLSWLYLQSHTNHYIIILICAWDFAYLRVQMWRCFHFPLIVHYIFFWCGLCVVNFNLVHLVNVFVFCKFDNLHGLPWDTKQNLCTMTMVWYARASLLFRCLVSVCHSIFEGFKVFSFLPNCISIDIDCAWLIYFICLL